MSMTTPLLFVTLGPALVGMSWLCSKGKLKRNGFAGMRTSQTMASDEAWMAAHKASAWSLAVDGALVFGTGLWLVVSRPPEAVGKPSVLGCALAVLVVTVIGGIQADRGARRVNRRNSGRPPRR